MRTTFLFLIIIANTFLSFGQNDSVIYYLSNNRITVELPRVQKPPDTCTTCLKPYGKKFKVNLPINKWSLETTDSFQVYSIQILAPNALYIDITFSSFIIGEKCKLSLYSVDNNTYREYSQQHTKNQGEYNVLSVKGDRAVLQFYVTKNMQPNDDLIISSVVYIYTDISKESFEIDRSLDCQIDVNCSEGNSYKDVIRSVILIRNLCKDNGDCFQCSGGLLNNTRQDYTPYVLTAHHCVVGSIEDNLDETIFYFNYQSSTCKGNDPPFSSSDNPYKIVGADLKAQRTSTLGSDFALLKLNSNMPLQYNVFYSGWSRERNLTGSSVQGIHHPSGDVKKISFGHVQGISLADYLNVKWDEGTIEEGSSGSPLFKNKQVIGQLSGGLGSNTCEHLGDILYGHFASSWGSTFGSERRLRDWLDPENEDPDDWDGADPNNDCVSDLNLAGVFPRTDYQSESIILQATNTITISNAEIQSSGNYIFRAGNNIYIEPETIIELGSNIEFKIEPCISARKISSLNINNDTLNEFIDKPKSIVRKQYENTLICYPNPFDEHTHIEYSFKESSPVHLSVYNVFGQQVATLVNLPNQEAGVYQVTFHAGNLPSGIYFYTLRADNFMETKKMVLMK